MNKQRAKEIVMTHACCSFTNTGNKLCLLCPWNRTNDCKNTLIDEETVIKAMEALGGGRMRKMKLSDIKISNAFTNTTPSESKMDECRFNWNMWRRQDRFIVVDDDNMLIDGYIQYLVLMEHKEEYAEVKISNKRKKRWYRKNVEDWKVPHYRNETTTYIYGFHPNSKQPKELVWRVSKSWKGWENDLLPGDMIYVETKYGVRKIVITKIEWLEKCPVDMPVKRVIRKVKRQTS